MGLQRTARRHPAKNQGGQKKELDIKKRAIKNIHTAASMYQAFHVLIEAYEKGRDGKKEEQDRAAGSLLAANTLGAFGIENALKALIRREGKEPGNIHNLRKLYDKLYPKTQRSICEKAAAIGIRVNGEVRHIRLEGAIDEHQESFEEWRYRESGKDLPVILGVLQGTLHALIQVHSEKYGEDLKREEKQNTGGVTPAMDQRAMEYYANVLMPKSGC